MGYAWTTVELGVEKALGITKEDIGKKSLLPNTMQLAAKM
jgi:hypothetical protein